MTKRQIEVLTVVVSIVLAPVESYLATTRSLIEQPATSAGMWWLVFVGYFVVAALMNWVFIKLWRSRMIAD